ncbi:hypothetical protein [Sulfitobacter guttiformis]|uniref:MotA/TolQ/ExbB proton channel domain-containing protein n=1 Tax=Sulfitobacter guttiformis TaxID=74349 RepID=A0A420DHC9_9RHOB|nr:hypothetical protein [Sulfitobacter guttiformis]KIN72643.1 hypothetical protein Z949_1821 [Sulfitobacter guttiformis KCTC 32187]RKE93628.1 hypothetical protein C8N30_2705 [Sulfitobacter guttiformis]
MAFITNSAENSKKPIVYVFTGTAGLLSAVGFVFGIAAMGFAIIGELMNTTSGVTETTLYLFVSGAGLFTSSTILGLLYEISISLKKLR